MVAKQMSNQPDRFAAGVKAAAEVAHLWAASHSCDAHDDNPCCHVRTGAGIEEKILALVPSPTQVSEKQDASFIHRFERGDNGQCVAEYGALTCGFPESHHIHQVAETENLAAPDGHGVAGLAEWDRDVDPCWSCGGKAEARDDIHVRCIDSTGVNCEVMNHWYTRKTWNTRASVSLARQELSVEAALAELRELFPETNEALLTVCKREQFGQLAQTWWTVSVWDLKCTDTTLEEAMQKVREWRKENKT